MLYLPLEAPCVTLVDGGPEVTAELALGFNVFFNVST